MPLVTSSCYLTGLVIERKSQSGFIFSKAVSDFPYLLRSILVWEVHCYRHANRVGTISGDIESGSREQCHAYQYDLRHSGDESVGISGRRKVLTNKSCKVKNLSYCWTGALSLLGCPGLLVNQPILCVESAAKIAGCFCTETWNARYPSAFQSACQVPRDESLTLETARLRVLDLFDDLGRQRDNFPVSTLVRRECDDWSGKTCW